MQVFVADRLTKIHFDYKAMVNILAKNPYFFPSHSKSRILYLPCFYGKISLKFPCELFDIPKFIEKMGNRAKRGNVFIFWCWNSLKYLKNSKKCWKFVKILAEKSLFLPCFPVFFQHLISPPRGGTGQNIYGWPEVIIL